MNDGRLVRSARNCAALDGSCENCRFDKDASLAHSCVTDLIGALAERVETLSDRCARYAEEIAVRQERERWISTEEALLTPLECVLGYVPVGAGESVHECYVDNGGYWHSLAFYDSPRVTHWRPIPMPESERREGGHDGER